MSLRKLFTRFSKTTVEQAQERAALLQGEHTFSSVMADFYQQQCESLDPDDDINHWTFAEAKQKFLDNRADMARLARAVDEAQAKLTATIQSEQR